MRINVFKNKSGRWFGIDGLFMALIAVANGSQYLGMLGVISSAVLGFSGYYFAANLIA
jgi:hypothetical protein